MRLLWAAVLLAVPLGGCLAEKEVIPEQWAETPDIHPGMRLYFRFDEAYSQCTAGFLFASPDNDTLYLAVSAHCLHGAGDLSLGAPVYGQPPGLGVRPIGEVAFDGWSGDQTLARDFALVALSNREGVREAAHPAVPTWGGPLSVADSSMAVPGTRVVSYGNSMQRESGDNAVEGRLFIDPLEDAVQVRLDRPAIQGDSGGPLLTWDGNALGILHGGRMYQALVIEEGFDVFTPLDGAIAMLRAEGAAGVRDARLVPWDAWNGPERPV